MKKSAFLDFRIPHPRILDVLRHGYSRQDAIKDAFSGISVGIIALPLSMAIAIASGAGPAQGIYTAAIAGFIASALGGSRFLISGPSGTLVVVSYSIIAARGLPALAAATMMAGFILILLGLSGFGKLIKYIPYPVTTGFTAGIGILIFSQQIKDFAGLPIPALAPDFPSQWKSYFGTLGLLNPSALGMGIGTLGTLLLIRRLLPRLPAAIIAIGLGLGAAAAFGLPVETIGSRFGGIAGGLPRPALPPLDWGLLRELVPEAFTLAFLISIETLLSAVVGDSMTSGRHDSSMELIAQGVANLGASLFGGVPATAALARTAANVKNGARSPVSGMVHALCLLLFVVVLAPFASNIPLASLAAVLMLVAWDMSDLTRVGRLILSAPRSDVFVLLATLGLALFVGITTAVQVGFALAVLLFFRMMIEVGGVRIDTERKYSSSIPPGMPAHRKDVEIFEIQGPFFFGVADILQDTLEDLEREPKAYILSMGQVPAIDSTGIAAMESFLRHCRHKKTRMFICGLREQPRKAMERSGFLSELGHDNVKGTVEEAIAASEA